MAEIALITVCRNLLIRCTYLMRSYARFILETRRGLYLIFLQAHANKRHNYRMLHEAWTDIRQTGT